MVDQLEDLLRDSSQVPLSAYRMVRTNEFEQVIARMRITVPSSIRESERTLSERDRILADAHAEAEQIIANAKDQAREILSENALLIAARGEAERILEESREMALRRTEEADAYAVQALRDLSTRLQHVLREVSNGVEIMQGNSPSIRQEAKQETRQETNDRSEHAAQSFDTENP